MKLHPALKTLGRRVTARAILWSLAIAVYIGDLFHTYVTASHDAIETAAHTKAYRTVCPDGLMSCKFIEVPVHVNWWANVFAPTALHAVIIPLGFVAILAIKDMWKADAERKAARAAEN